MLIRTKFEGYWRDGRRLYLGGGNSAPPPDPRLVEAQIRSMGIQDELLAKIVGQAEAMLPTQMEQMRFGLDSARTAFDQSQQDRQYALERRNVLTGLQDQLVQDAKQFNEGGRRQELRDEASADVNSAFSNAQGQAARMASRMGINPNSGRASALRTNTSLAHAAALAGATQKASDTARAERYALTDRATNALAGYPAMGMQTTGTGAAYAASGIDLANKGAAGTTAGYGAAANTAGQMGANATNMWNAQANYQANMQQQGDTLGSILGGVGGLALGLSKWSDPRLKENVVLVGKDEATGLNLYEFNYVGGSKRFRGVMADEVEAIRPDAVRVDEDGFMSVYYDKLGLEMVEVQ